LLLPAAWLAVQAQTQLEAPAAGCLLDASRRLVTLWGVAGSLVPGKALAAGVDGAACGPGHIMIRAGNTLVVLAPDGSEVSRLSATESWRFVAASGDRAAAWRPGAVVVWKAGIWTETPVQGQWRALALSKDGVIGLIAEDAGLRLRFLNASGQIVREEAVGAQSQAAFLWPDGALLLWRGEELYFRSPTGGERLIDLAVSRVEAVSKDWVQAAGPAGLFALRRVGDFVEWFALPEEGGP